MMETYDEVFNYFRDKDGKPYDKSLYEIHVSDRLDINIVPKESPKTASSSHILST